MTLSFSTKWGKEMGELAGNPNYFVNKIWRGFIDNNLFELDDFEKVVAEFEKKHFWRLSFGYDYTRLEQIKMLLKKLPKLHTIRHDPHDRWKAGDKIHFVINNRTKNRFQFAPVIEVKSVQSVKFRHIEWRGCTDHISVYIDSQFKGSWYLKDRVFEHATHNSWVKFNQLNIHQLAINDGFDSVDDFFKFFNKDFVGKIIHWTDLKY